MFTEKLILILTFSRRVFVLKTTVCKYVMPTKEDRASFLETASVVFLFHRHVEPAGLLGYPVL